MKYGMLTPNQSVNSSIYGCFKLISKEDEAKFVNKLRSYSNDETQFNHTYRELLLGAFLCSSGLKSQYERKVDGQSPDWCIMNNEVAIAGIVELINFHTDQATENELEAMLQANSCGMVWVKKNDNRLYQSIWRKIGVYKELVSKRQTPYVVAIFGEPLPNVTLNEVKMCLSEEDTGLFYLYRELSGVLFFKEGTDYWFEYIPNPNPFYAFILSSGSFSPQKTDL